MCKCVCVCVCEYSICDCMNKSRYMCVCACVCMSVCVNKKTGIVKMYKRGGRNKRGNKNIEIIVKGFEKKENV